MREISYCFIGFVVAFIMFVLAFTCWEQYRCIKAQDEQIEDLRSQIVDLVESNDNQL